jgi:AraC-like DNA-binding protein
LKGHYPEVARWEGKIFEPKQSAEVNFTLVSVLKGEGGIQVEGLVSDFRQGDLFFLIPNREHRAWSASKYQCQFLCLDFSPELVGDDTFYHHFLEDIIDPGLKCIISGSSSEAESLRPLITEIENFLKSKELDNYLLIKARIIELIYHLRCYYKQTGQLSASAPPDQSRKYHRLLPTLNYIQKNIHLKHSVPSLAHYCNFSTSRFAHLFLEVMGRSVGDYLLEIRMEKARTLLLSSSLSLEQIAATLGLSSAKILSRQFKKYFKTTPRLFCKKSKKS